MKQVSLYRMTSFRKYFIIVLSLSIATLIACNYDDFYESMDLENHLLDSTKSVYFNIADTGITHENSSVIGDDGDYINTPASIDYDDNLDGTVTDNVTKLMWLKCSLVGNSKVDNDIVNCSTTHVKYKWMDAVVACAKLDYAGYDDWRLPTMSELNNLVDLSIASGPAINSEFPNTEYDAAFTFEPEKCYWSITRNLYDYALAINFLNGMTFNPKISTSTHYVRCVRNK